MRIFGSTRAGRTTGALFVSLAASVVWAILVTWAASKLMSLSQETAQLLAGVVFVLVQLFFTVVIIRRVVAGREPL